jgi:crossover junction endodeoxyribonuclease RusA
MSLTFTLPQPPTANALFLNVRGRGRVKTQRYKAWITEAGWLAKTAAVGKPPLTGNIEVEYMVSNARHFDAGNLEKALSDLLVRVGIIEDDKHISSIRITRRDDKKPEVHVTVKVAT